MSIVTNKPTHATTLILPALGIRNYFGEIVCRDSATPPFTSKAQMLIDLLERQAILADETLMVGDTLEDCHAAAAAGIALINCTGNLGGFFSPAIIGFLKTRTGTLNSGLFLIAGCMIASAILILTLIPAKVTNR